MIRASDMIEVIVGVRCQWGDIPVVVTGDKEAAMMFYQAAAIVNGKGEITEEGKGDPEVVLVIADGG
jgi:hypothetical protein